MSRILARPLARFAARTMLTIVPLAGATQTVAETATTEASAQDVVIDVSNRLFSALATELPR